MVTFNDIPSTTTILSTYTSFTASTMLIRTIAKEVKTMTTQIIPQPLQQKFTQICGAFFTQFSSQITLIFDQHAGFTLNEIYEAAEIYLRTKITPSVDKLRVSKTPKEKVFLVTVDGGQEIIDIFQELELKWKLNCTVVKNSNGDDGPYHSQSEKKWFELRCHKKHYNTVMDSYLPYVLQQSKTIKEENKMVMLYSLGIYGYANVNMGNNVWGSVKFDHPATFDTLAMDPKLKKDLLEDLDRFVRRRKFYRRVGKAWKRGYLLYGPPGTGKSSLIAAMANYLSFSIYDLELANLRSNSELRRLLGSTTNRSILVIEDIDCSVELQDRAHFGGAFDSISPLMPIGLQGGPSNNNTQNKTSQLTLSGLLNFIDGLWSSCGDERIIVFTTNHKDRIDPALLRPGRMDMHIHMSYITPCGFKLLASNYLMIDDHFLFKEIEVLIKQVNVTPAEVAEELMKSDDACTSLKGLIDLLYWKKREHDESNAEHGKESEQESKRQRIEAEN